jgi:ABC-type dipeptide/oligopeptide/nickel transport system permease component
MGTTRKFTAEIDTRLHAEFVTFAKQNGLTRRHVLEEALRSCLHNVVSSQHSVRPEVLDAFAQSVAVNQDLLKRLAK